MQVRRGSAYFAGAIVVSLFLVSQAEAAEWFVSAGGSGTGTKAAPFGRIQDALNSAQPGDIVTVRPGTYRESFRTVRHGTAKAPIRVRSLGERGAVVVTTSGRVLTVDHAYFTLEGFVLDGQYGLSDTVRTSGGADYFTLRNSEVRRSTHDLIDIVGDPTGILIEDCLIHHALNAANGRTDAHGVAAGAVRNLTIRNTEIHTFSGDAFQVDPGRSAPGWTGVVVDSVRMWLGPLPAAENGFPAGAVTGENAIDTKAGGSFARATLTVRNTTAWGFRNGLIGNMAAFNLKENINATLDGVTVYDSEIAFRLRGGGSSTTGAWVTLKNAVVHDVLTAYRYEDNIQVLRIWNNTLGRGVTRAFQDAASTRDGLEVRNLLMMGGRPVEAADPSNMTATEDAFVDASRHNYRLAPSAPAINAGTTIAAVQIDRDGVRRPVGGAYEVGAYEWQFAETAEVVAHAWTAPLIAGHWRVIIDPTAAGGARLSHPDAGAATIASARKAPRDYFEVRVPVEAGRPYRLWLRGRADENLAANDSVFVQFSSAVNANGAGAYAIGTSAAMVVNIEDCSGCGLNGWGWQDNGAGVERLGPVVTFGTSGLQTIRIQTREDGVSIDQIVLSPLAYLASAPGARHSDTVHLE